MSIPDAVVTQQEWLFGLTVVVAAQAVVGTVSLTRQPQLSTPPQQLDRLLLLFPITVFAMSGATFIAYLQEGSAYSGLVMVTIALEVVMWCMCSVAMVHASWARKVPTCSMPCFVLCAVCVKGFALSVPGYMPLDLNDDAVASNPGQYGYMDTPTHPSTFKSATLVPIIVGIQACLAAFLWCVCCGHGFGVHERITGVPKRPLGSKPSGGQRSLLGDDVARAAAPSDAVASVASASTPPTRSRVRAGLTPRQVEAFYDGFGRLQDFESFLYTDKASKLLRRMAPLQHASTVVEVGCGTGAFAEKLLRSNLSPSCRCVAGCVCVRVCVACCCCVLPCAWYDDDDTHRRAFSLLLFCVPVLLCGCRYIGLDISTTMVNLTTARLQKWSDRVDVVKVDGTAQFPPVVTAQPVDAIVATFVFCFHVTWTRCVCAIVAVTCLSPLGMAARRYVFDAMPDALIFGIINAAEAALSENGVLCVCSLTYGGTPLASAITDGWVATYRMSPKSMGGCRPLEFARLLESTGRWNVVHSSVVTQMALSSSIVVARPIR